MCLAVQSRPTLCDPMDYSPTGFSVHEILQARIVEGVAIPFSKGYSDLGIDPHLLPLCYLGSSSHSHIHTYLYTLSEGTLKKLGIQFTFARKNRVLEELESEGHFSLCNIFVLFKYFTLYHIPLKIQVKTLFKNIQTI